MKTPQPSIKNTSQPFKHIHDRYPNCRRDVEDFWQQTDAMKRVMEQYAKKRLAGK
ncbi:MAG: hypothetical protein R3B95_17660 [Nitrospirales bacterium]|nr:hypothetical protein [Nitrospirales bacterium]